VLLLADPLEVPDAPTAPAVLPAVAVGASGETAPVTTVPLPADPVAVEIPVAPTRPVVVRWVVIVQLQTVS